MQGAVVQGSCVSWCSRPGRLGCAVAEMVYWGTVAAHAPAALPLHHTCRSPIPMPCSRWPHTEQALLEDVAVANSQHAAAATAHASTLDALAELHGARLAALRRQFDGDLAAMQGEFEG